MDRHNPNLIGRIGESNLNQPVMSGAVDLDGHSRIDRFSGVVDMGCYEYIYNGIIYGFGF